MIRYYCEARESYDYRLSDSTKVVSGVRNYKPVASSVDEVLGYILIPFDRTAMLSQHSMRVVG